MPTLTRPLSTREIERRLERAHRQRDAAPTKTQTQRVVVRLDPDVATIEEELCLLGALEALKQQHDKVNLVYAYANKEIGPLLRGRWFLKDAALCGCSRTFQVLVGTDFGVTLSEPDPAQAAAAEEELYNRDYQIRLADVQTRQAAAQQAGAKDLVLPEPEYFFQPRWHRTNGYLWQLSEELGLVTAMPTRPLNPFSDFPKDVYRPIWQALQKAKLTSKPFVVFDFAHETEILPMLEALGKSLPAYELVSLQELLRVIPGDAVSLAVALSHTNCRYAVGPVGTFLLAAWAGGVPNIYCLYTGANIQWDGVHAPNTYTVARDRLTDQQMAQAISQGLVFLTDKANRKGLG